MFSCTCVCVGRDDRGAPFALTLRGTPLYEKTKPRLDRPGAVWYNVPKGYALKAVGPS